MYSHGKKKEGKFSDVMEFCEKLSTSHDSVPSTCIDICRHLFVHSSLKVSLPSFCRHCPLL